MIKVYVQDATNSYLYVSGLVISSFIRLTVVSGAVTASEQYIDTVAATMTVADTYITNANSITALTFGTLGGANQVFIATLNLNSASRTISYKKTLPQSLGPNPISILVSPTKFYFS